MQLARSFWLDQDKTFKRKIAEIFLTIELERRFTKEQLIEFYANEIYLGRSGSFSIHGFGEAARTYSPRTFANSRCRKRPHWLQSSNGRVTTIRFVIPNASRIVAISRFN